MDEIVKFFDSLRGEPSEFNTLSVATKTSGFLEMLGGTVRTTGLREGDGFESLGRTNKGKRVLETAAPFERGA